tara:strand:- start:1929 stop:5384 length:3456 start_codon:yes stop_codon:yes gene_type:complete
MEISTPNIEDVILYIKLKLSALGHSIKFPKEKNLDNCESNERIMVITKSFIQDYQEKTRLLSGTLNPVDTRLQNFLDGYLGDIDKDIHIRLPEYTLILDRPGLARVTSVPFGKYEFKSNIISSYKLKQGILNNPQKDKRTTKGSFHLVEGGLPVPVDKKEVPKTTFGHLIQAALHPPKELMLLPFTQSAETPAHLFVSLLLRPIVCPDVPGIISEKSLETRFFVPGSLVSNLDFVESIFGNAGDPNLAENDAGLDVDHWTGHTGCIILAPHLVNFKKKDIGLPHVSEATDRQKKDKMCWEDSDEYYNDGVPFKITCRDEKGVAVTLIADNYYGYSKKEIKTQISYSANLYGLVEEEHAGGALVFSRKSIQSTFTGERFLNNFTQEYSFSKIKNIFGSLMDIEPNNYAVDKKFPNIIYIPENSEIDLYEGFVKWKYEGEEQKMPVSPDKFYIFPTGHLLKMVKHPTSGNWEIISTAPEGVFCHKPCTVSGGGKSEISKTLSGAIIYGPFYIGNFKETIKEAEKVINYNYKNRWKNSEERTKPSRGIFDSKRTLGSVIKLLTPSEFHTDEYNAFIESIPIDVKLLILFIKMRYRDNVHESWHSNISVNRVNSREGNSFYFDRRKVSRSFLRVGFDKDGSWCMNSLRPDFMHSFKIQLEDDITASIVLPSYQFENLDPVYKNSSIKIVRNCEKSFFQRPDDAVIKGYDVRAEADIASNNNFLVNYEPLNRENSKNLVDFAVEFDKFTDPMKNLIKDFLTDGNKKDKYIASTSHTRIVNGEPTDNPRYLQKDIDHSKSIEHYLTETRARFHRNIPLDKPVYFPVHSVLPSRRNNPIDRENGIRPLSVYNPIHYQEIPELFMDFICSLTGKSPSTTGAGSEGALTKGPFNMLTATSDLNNALLAYILTGYDGFTSAAGYVGNRKFDHDISVLIPEIWCRLLPEQKNAQRMIREGSLEKIEDFEYEGEKILASRLGYRITKTFLFSHMGRIFDEPQLLFSEEILKPELQDMDAYVDGIRNITEAQQKVAERYFEDGSIEAAIPPLKFLLNIMAYGHCNGETIDSPNLSGLFKRDNVLKSDWYRERLKLKQKKDIDQCNIQMDYLKIFKNKEENYHVSKKLNIENRIKKLTKKLKYNMSDKYLKDLEGTIGADPLYIK